MRAVVQRVRSAAVTVDGTTRGEIGRGLLVFLGVGQEDDLRAAHYLADKVLGLRIFPDDEGKMNRSVVEIGGAILAISQFTLLGDCRKGRRPSFIDAAPPERAEPLYLQFAERLRAEPAWRTIPVLVVTAKDLTPEERLRLNGWVEQVLQKGAYSREELLAEVRALVRASVEQADQRRAERSGDRTG